MVSLPNRIAVDVINSQAAAYTERVKTWADVATLHTGGFELERNMPQFLRKRPKELSEVTQIRQAMASYTNLMGNIIGWYSTALWQEPAVIEVVGGGADLDKWREKWESDVTRTGQNITQFFQGIVEGLLLHQWQYVMIDLPNTDQPAASLGQQIDRGDLDAHLIQYQPQSVINWAEDDLGRMTWCVVKCREVISTFGETPKSIDCWYYYDPQQVAKYQVQVNNDGTPSTQKFAVMADGYPKPHALTRLNKMPIKRFSLPLGFWFGNRVKLPLINHFNLDNALDFGLFQSCLAQLVVKGDYGDAPMNMDGGVMPVTVSEVGFHKLRADGDMFYLEPQGRSFDAAQKRLDSLEERIYKACYLADQARTNKSTPTAQSGISKAQDKMPARDALAGIGDAVRPMIQSIYQDVLAIRGFTNAVVNVRGFNFNDRAIDRIELIDAASVIQVNSPTYERKVAKQVVREVFPDDDEVAQIEKEIDANPTPQQLLQQQQEAQRANAALKFNQALSKIA